jgi:hypothetical protein
LFDIVKLHTPAYKSKLLTSPLPHLANSKDIIQYIIDNTDHTIKTCRTAHPPNPPLPPKKLAPSRIWPPRAHPSLAHSEEIQKSLHSKCQAAVGCGHGYVIHAAWIMSRMSTQHCAYADTSGATSAKSNLRYVSNISILESFRAGISDVLFF